MFPAAVGSGLAGEIVSVGDSSGSCGIVEVHAASKAKVAVRATKEQKARIGMAPS